MKRTAKLWALLAAALIALFAAGRLTVFRDYTAHITLNRALGAEEELRLSLQEPSSVSLGEPVLRGDVVIVRVHPEAPGPAVLELRDGAGGILAIRYFRVDALGTVYDDLTGGFTGDAAVMIAVTVVWLAVFAAMLRRFLAAKGPAFYAYSTIHAAGFSLFALITGLMMLQITVQHLSDPAAYPVLYAYNIITSAGQRFIELTFPLILLFALAMAASNIALLRHERPRVQNALGLLVSALLVAGVGVSVLLSARDPAGEEWQFTVQSTIENVYATAYVYFECMLAGSVICGVKAARHVPAPGQDFIIILGCYFRPDGTLPPLLRGRVDRAIAFWRSQKELCGKEARFIPTGGMGRDETMTEAEAMRRYLVGQGIPDALILPETEARNTYQNMEFSRRIIEETQPGGSAVYATTNYHVFRSGLWASLAGLKAEGIGSRTKWWFWPNAFMRECLGLLRNRLKQEIVLLLALILLFGALSVLLG